MAISAKAASVARATTAKGVGGRPELAPEERRCKRVEVRLTIAEQIELRKSARTAGLKPSEFVRRRSLGIPVVPPKSTADATLLRELSAVGNNLNQLTHHLNAGRDAEASHTLTATLRDLRQTLVKVAAAYEE